MLFLKKDLCSAFSRFAQPVMVHLRSKLLQLTLCFQSFPGFKYHQTSCSVPVTEFDRIILKLGGGRGGGGEPCEKTILYLLFYLKMMDSRKRSQNIKKYILSCPSFFLSKKKEAGMKHNL